MRAPGVVTAAGQTSFTDPFAYCAAVGTVDAPDTRYAGPPVPEPIMQGLIHLGLVAADAPREILGHAVWRCLDGKVLVCHFGANLPCTTKADINRTPTAAMRDFCKTNAAAEDIPAVVTGRATIYQWRCARGVPRIVKQVITPDPRGFLSDFWQEIPSP